MNGPSRRRLMRVDAARDQLLAGAVLAEDQHAAVGRRRHGDLFAQLRHDVALADHRQPPVHARAQRPVLGFEPPLPDGVADDQHGLVERQRFLDEVERAHLDRAHRRLDVAVPGNHHHGESTRRSRSRDSVARPSMPGQPDVENDDVERRPRDAVETRLAALHRLDGVPFVTEHAAKRAAHAGLVVDDED